MRNSIIEAIGERAAISSSLSLPLLTSGKKTWPSSKLLGSAQACPIEIAPSL
jgi:hypothetical protein